MLNLSSSFAMTGYPSKCCYSGINVSAAGTDIAIIGNNAVFDANQTGRFFTVGGVSSVRLTVSNVHFKDGTVGLFHKDGGALYVGGGVVAMTCCVFSGNMAYSDDDDDGDAGGAIYVDGGVITLTSCVFSDNFAAAEVGFHNGEGGAIYATGSGTKVLILGGEFKPPISDSTNDIAIYKANVTFGCAPGSSGPSVPMQGNEITVIPPKELQCTAGKYLCHNGGQVNWQCVPTSTGGVSYSDCLEVCSP
jgi:hypothetical protein